MTKKLLDFFPLVAETRINHALEHATMQVLADKYQGVPMAGISSPRGFALLADLPTEIVTDAVLEAERRLKGGEKELAVHPHCGTNLAVSSLAAGAAAWLTLEATGGTKRIRVLPIVFSILMAVPVFFLSKPLGPWVQRNITTNADPGESRVRLVTSQKLQETFVHRIKIGR